MKASHRHELKTNELAEWIADFPQWAKKNWGTLTYISVIILIVVALYVYKGYAKNAIIVQKQRKLTNLLNSLTQNKGQVLQASSQGMDVSYLLIEMANKFNDYAKDTKDDQLAALAFIKSAESLRAELYYRKAIVTKHDIDDQVSKAKDAYQKALDRSSLYPTLAAAATYGLGLCKEELGNFDQAKQIYQDVLNKGDFSHTVTYMQAKMRLETIDDYKDKVVFAIPPRPITQPDIMGLQNKPLPMIKPAPQMTETAPSTASGTGAPNAPEIAQ